MIAENISEIKQILGRKAKLVIVSKFRDVEEIQSAYNTGERCFAENKVQALLERKNALPNDIEWHMIGHLQSNKVKLIAPFIRCIQSVDSYKLLQKINEEALKNNRIIDCLLQVHIAKEETKFGMEPAECEEVLQMFLVNDLESVRIIGLMGMASNTDNQEQIESEFKGLKRVFETLKTKWNLSELSMGMSSDYALALACGSTMVRIGSSIFAHNN